MRWPWQRREVRETATDYTSLVSRLIAAQADGQTTQATSTAAIEAAAGLLSRAFAGAEVVGEGWARDAVSARCRAQVGRDLVRLGESLHVIRLDATGGVHLVPCSTWYWEGDADPATWQVTATAYGPSGSETWRLPAAGAVFTSWGAATARPWHGIPPTGFAAATGRLAAEAERSLADEAAGPIAQLLAVPQDGGDGGDGDPLAALKADIGTARGRALLVETVMAGWGEGRGAAPLRDWMASRLGPAPPQGMVSVADHAFARVLAACGCSPALFDNSDGTSKREAMRQWHLHTVKPLADMLAAELTAKLETSVELRFDLYNVDLAGRAQAFQRLVQGGVGVNEALATSGLLVGDA